jgi:hypothetical protein
MADDRLREALLLVAKRVITNALRTDIAPEWENYPEIGLNDWEAIERLIAGEVEGRYGVTDESYFAAYEYLEGRTTDEAVP